MNRKTFFILFTILSALTLGACGGGGDSIPPGMDATGTWKGDFLGHETYVVLQERTGNHILGYLPVDPGTWISEGSRSGSDVTINFAAKDPKLNWSGNFSGTLHGNTLSGTFDNGDGPVSVSFTRNPMPFSVEHWLFGHGETGAPTSLFPKLEHPGGGFLAGGFVGQENCNLLACAGDVTSWDISGFSNTISTASIGDCPSTSTMNGVWDSTTKIMQGDFNTTHCMGTENGLFFGAKEGLTDKSSVQQVLEMFSRLAEHIEAEAPVTTEFSASYLNDGRTRAVWVDGFNWLYTQYNDLTAQIILRQIVTANDAEVHPFVTNPARVQWRLIVSGVPEGGGPREIAVEVTPKMFPGDDDFFWIKKETGRYVFSGNGSASPFTMDMPIAVEDMTKAIYGLWPYGVHGGGGVYGGGHPEGHPGWDIEYVAGAKARAVADGVVVSIYLDPDWWNHSVVTIQHRPGVQSAMNHLQDVEPGIEIGATVARGDVIGTAGTISPEDPSHYMIHFGVGIGTDTVCPADLLSLAGQTVLDTIWTTAEYDEELVEPYRCNPIDVSFPLTRVWSRESGIIVAQGTNVETIEFTRVAADLRDYTYTLRDVFDAVIETGTVPWMDIRENPYIAIDLKPDGGGATHRARIDIVSDTMRIDWNDTTRPADLSGAAVFSTPLP